MQTGRQTDSVMVYDYEGNEWKETANVRWNNCFTLETVNARLCMHMPRAQGGVRPSQIIIPFLHLIIIEIIIIISPGVTFAAENDVRPKSMCDRNRRNPAE